MKNNKRSLGKSIISLILILSIISINLNSLSIKVSAGPETVNMAKDQIEMIPGPDESAGYRKLKEKVKVQPKKEHVLTEETRKKAMVYLAAVSLENGGDVSSLTNEEMEAIKDFDINDINSNDLFTASSGSAIFWDNVGLGQQLEKITKEAEIAELMAYEKSFSENYGKLLSQEKKSAGKQLSKLKEAVEKAKNGMDNIVKRFKIATNDKTIKKIIRDSHDAKGKLTISSKELTAAEQKIEQTAGTKASELADKAADEAKAEITKTGRTAKVLGVLLGLLTIGLDVKDLVTDDMASKKTGNKELINVEKFAVGLDAVLAAIGIAAVLTSKTVMIGTATYSAITVLGTTIAVSVNPVIAFLWLGTLLLAHTETGQNIVKDTTSWITDKILGGWDYLVGNKFGVDNMGDKMIEHINDNEYMEQLLIKLANKNAGRTKPANGVGALKPNIYLYPEEQTDIVVSFEHPELLTTVIPDYSGNWSVEAAPDGTLQAEDGNEYSYLFYESETQPFFFGNKEGWLIKADERAERYTEILTEYGFNEKEIADFVEFWVEKLPEGVDYMMYPNVTEVIDKAMPVSFSTEPDSIFRIWFTFEVYDDQEVPEPEVEEFIRDGFTLVEWGGVILN